MSRGKLHRYFRHGLLQQLLVFESVARLGSVTRAAVELHMAQPTVSVQLKKLAESMGIVMFETQGRSLRLTPAGEALLRSCDDLIECLHRTEERLAPWRQPTTARLLLAAEPEARSVASRLIAAFCARHPSIQASLHIAERNELLTRLASEVDDVYLFTLEVDGLPADRRWSIAHSKKRELAHAAAQFLREALVNEVAATSEVEERRIASRTRTQLPTRPP